jgi:hypothetical protein
MNDFARQSGHGARSTPPRARVTGMHTIFVLASLAFGLAVVAAALVGVIVLRVTTWQNTRGRLTHAQR